MKVISLAGASDGAAQATSTTTKSANKPYLHVRVTISSSFSLFRAVAGSTYDLLIFKNYSSSQIH